ncbi:hypothetical protein [Flavobacterium ginsengiterrae]|uniref:GLPGLI family protein n=1 Tax=Flavobacterium ginsengiterrae TaxID=871695 RepID=A0ABP7GT11_9FLAO
MELKKITILIFSLLLSPIFGQQKKLIELRDIHCETNCEFYHENLNFRKSLLNKPPTPFSSTYNDTLVSFFKIPLDERRKIFPFSKYDTVYVVTPKYYEDKEPRNYIKPKFHDSKTLVAKEQLDKISDIFFNYYEIKDNNIVELKYKITGCNGIEDTYPKIILLFVKNGKPKDYIAFPSQIFRRTSFSNKELEGLDLCAQKENMIMEMFGVNLEEPEGELPPRDEDGILSDEYK